MLFGRETLEKIEEWDNLPEFDNGENFKGKLLDNDSVKITCGIFISSTDVVRKGEML